MLGLRPRHLAQEPGAGRQRGEGLVPRLRHHREVDEARLVGRGHAVRDVEGREGEHLGARRHGEALRVLRLETLDRALHDLMPVGRAGALRVEGEILDVQDRPFRARRGDDRAGAAPAEDQPGRGEGREGLAHGHARAAVFRDQLVLEGDAMARRPFARQDPPLDVAADALVDGFHPRRPDQARRRASVRR